MTCKHEQIRTWVFEDTEEPAGMWSCVKCGLKFEPINQRKPLKDEQIGMAFRKAFPVGGVVFTNGAIEFARAIEAAHGIKGDA